VRLSDRKDIVKIKRILFTSTVSLLTVVGVFLIVYLKKSRGVYYEEEAFVMGTRVRVVVASERFSSRSLADNVISEFRRIDAKFDPYREGSVLYKLNHSNGWVDVDEETFNLIDSAIRYCKATGGVFDPTLGRVIKLWGFDKFSEKTEFRVPTDEEIGKALAESGCDKVKLDEKDQRVMLNGVWLDLGGIVKGYALERSYAIIKGLDPKATGFIDAGGEIRIIGPKYGYAPWTIGVEIPGDPMRSTSYTSKTVRCRLLGITRGTS
jgi:thiamine biosynthesis lipoprotein